MVEVVKVGTYGDFTFYDRAFKFKVTGDRPQARMLQSE